MTFKVVKLSTSATDTPGLYQVRFNGDDRFFRTVDIHVAKDLGPNALDFVELYGAWCCLIWLELAGSNRTSRNLKLVVSRGAVKRLLLVASSKEELYQYAYSLRTQLLGLDNISVEKGKAWTTEDHPGICVKWDGEPPAQPSVENLTFGRIYLTYHTVMEYLDETKGECKLDNVFSRLTRIVRDADREMALPAKQQTHKSRRYGASQDGVRYLGTASGWQIVTRPTPDGKGLIALTVYQRIE
jgi:hypothetical protein